MMAKLTRREAELMLAELRGEGRIVNKIVLEALQTARETLARR